MPQLASTGSSTRWNFCGRSANEPICSVATEIEHTKEADTPGEIPGRSGLQADRRTGNKFIMRGAWLRSKEMEEIIMTLSMKEKKILYAYGCLSHHNTVTRLKWLTALTVDPEAKRRMLGLGLVAILPFRFEGKGMGKREIEEA